MTETDREFLDMCLYFLTEKGDPTRYTEWNESKFQHLAPRVYDWWRRREFAARRLAEEVRLLHG